MSPFSVLSIQQTVFYTHCMPSILSNTQVWLYHFLTIFKNKCSLPIEWSTKSLVWNLKHYTIWPRYCSSHHTPQTNIRYFSHITQPLISSAPHEGSLLHAFAYAIPYGRNSFPGFTSKLSFEFPHSDLKNATHVTPLTKRSWMATQPSTVGHNHDLGCPP